MPQPDDNFEIKFATREDVPVIHELINNLAEYEKLTHEVTGTVEMLENSLFGKNSNIYAILGFEGETPVGFALYFYNYSTFLGKKGLYLEDLFVLPGCRGKGYGKKLLAKLASIAVSENCGRFEWSVLDWNEPAINFYKSLGANPMDEWTVFRMTEDKMKQLAKQI